MPVEGASSSLRIITKDAINKFRIITFASSKKSERGMLSTSIKAYKVTAKLIIEAVLAERESKQAHNKTQSKKKAADQALELEPALKLESKEFEKTVVYRRVKRRVARKMLRRRHREKSTDVHAQRRICRIRYHIK